MDHSAQTQSGSADGARRAAESKVWSLDQANHSIPKALANNISRFLDLQDAATRTRVELQQVREAAIRAKKKLDQPNYQASETTLTSSYDGQSEQIVRAGTLDYGSLFDIDLEGFEEAQGLYKDVEMRLVHQEAQLVAEGDKLRLSLIQYSGNHGNSQQSNTVLSGVDQPAVRLRSGSRHSTQFSFVSDTGLEQSSVVDPDRPKTPIEEEEAMEDRADLPALMDYYAPDLLHDSKPNGFQGSKWFDNVRPEQYVSDAFHHRISRTNSEEHMEPALSELLERLIKKVPAIQKSMQYGYLDRTLSASSIRWILHFSDLRQNVHSMISSQILSLNTIEDAWSWNAPIRDNQLSNRQRPLLDSVARTGFMSPPYSVEEPLDADIRSLKPITRSSSY